MFLGPYGVIESELFKVRVKRSFTSCFIVLQQIHLRGTKAMGRLKRPWASQNMADQFTKMQGHMKDMNREKKGFKKRDKANDRRAKNKLKTRGKK